MLKSGQRICGSGAALGTAPIVQNKAYFQVSIQQNGIWGIGVATRSAVLNSVPVTANCWVLREDGQIAANGELLGKIDEPIEEGDCIVSIRFLKR
ncbi:unnamed protein product [Gongylonema pulchrum]|uniref:Uncharacterized protein n=1 Tax=Gongylonema pulchrum TaxID=637853 RepID=A0A3P6TG51_9BILA|nr:unnamed protein product [Gongylonema pulchrum]